MIDEARERLRGVVATSVTPFGPDGAIDVEALTAIVSRMAGAGVALVAPNGGTGEFASLSADERRLAIDVVADALADTGTTLLPGVGLDCASATADARQARDRGATGVMVHQPAHPYQTAAGWVAYHREIAAAVPELAVVPYVRSPLVDAGTVAALAAECPNVVGVKYGLPDLQRFAALVEATAAAGLVWVCGIAEAWAPFFRLAGAEGFTSGLVNVEPELSVALFDALDRGDGLVADELWRAFRPLEELRARHAGEYNVAVVKEALAQRGLARRDVRPPMSPLPADERELVATLLARLQAVAA